VDLGVKVQLFLLNNILKYRGESKKLMQKKIGQEKGKGREL
jgi:hypothetical protein